MKTFTQLTSAEQETDVERCLNHLLRGVVEGAIRFSDDINEDGLQARIDTALEEADDMQTPWFAGEYVMDTCRDDMEGMARCEAEDALYSEPHEHVIVGIARGAQHD